MNSINFELLRSKWPELAELVGLQNLMSIMILRVLCSNSAPLPKT